MLLLEFVVKKRFKDNKIVVVKHNKLKSIHKPKSKEYSV